MYGTFPALCDNWQLNGFPWFESSVKNPSSIIVGEKAKPRTGLWNCFSVHISVKMQNSPRSSLWKEAFLPFLDATVSCIFNLTEERHSLSWGPVRKPVFWEKPRVHLTSVWHFFVSCSVLVQLSCTKSAKWIIESFLGGCDHEVDNHCLTERLSWFLASWLFYNKKVYILWVKSIQWYFLCKIMSCLHPTCLPETVCMCFFLLLHPGICLCVPVYKMKAI